MPKRPYPRYRRRHHAILLAACRDPSKTQRQIAEETGYSLSQLSRIMCSPDFQQVYDSLIREHAFELRCQWLERTSHRPGAAPTPPPKSQAPLASICSTSLPCTSPPHQTATRLETSVLPTQLGVHLALTRLNHAHQPHHLRAPMRKTK